MSKTNPNLKRQTRKAVFQYAFMRWESAVVIGGTILLTYFIPQPFPGWPVWGWPALGGFALLVLVISTITDNASKAQVQVELTQEHYNPRNILDPVLHREVERALDYQRSIQAYVAQQREGQLKTWLEDITRQTEDWVDGTYALAMQLDKFRHDPLLAQDRESLPRELETLTSRRHQESNVDVQQQLDEVIISKRKQWESLRALDERMTKAEVQLEQSNTALATAGSQVQRINRQDIHTNRADQLQQEIAEQVTQLNDLVSSISEIYDYQGS